MIAIIPAAGLGTRMTSVTGGEPKELLLLAGRTVLDWVLDEAFAAGVDGALLVVSPSKPGLQAWPRTESRVQKAPNGLGGAVLAAECFDDALVVLPDTVYFPRTPSTRLVQMIRQGADIAVPVEAVPDDLVSSYGIVELGDKGIVRILEKPSPAETASRLAIAGRFALSAPAMRMLPSLAEAMSGEIGLTPMLTRLIELGLTAQAHPLRPDEQRLDCGDPEGYRRAKRIMAS